MAESKEMNILSSTLDNKEVKLQIPEKENKIEQQAQPIDDNSEAMTLNKRNMLNTPILSKNNEDKAYQEGCFESNLPSWLYIILFGIVVYLSLNQDMDQADLLLIRGIVFVVLSGFHMAQKQINLFSVPEGKAYPILISSIFGLISVFVFYLNLPQIQASILLGWDSLSMIAFVLVETYKKSRASSALGILGVILGMLGFFLLFSGEDGFHAWPLFSIAIANAFEAISIKSAANIVNPIIHFTCRQTLTILICPFFIFAKENKPIEFLAFCNAGVIGVADWLSLFFLSKALMKEKYLSRLFSGKFLLLIVLGLLSLEITSKVLFAYTILISAFLCELPQ